MKHENDAAEEKRIVQAIRSNRTLKRLESPQGPERELVPSTRSGEEPVDAEDLREGKAVPPGEAKAALLVALELLDDAAACSTYEASLHQKRGNSYDARIARKEAARLNRAKKALITLLPKPDSGARRIPAARPNHSPSTGAPASPPTGDERSGRRNDPAQARRAGD